MGFFKKIIKVEVIGQTEGISEDEQLSNYAAGHMMCGFNGMVHASLLNDSEGPTTTFRIFYDNNTVEIKSVLNSSLEYRNLITRVN